MADARIKQTVRREPNINNPDHKSKTREQKLSVKYGQIVHTGGVVQVPPAGEDFSAGDRVRLELLVVGTAGDEVAFWGTDSTVSTTTGTLVPITPSFYIEIPITDTIYCWTVGTTNKLHWRSYGAESV